MTKVIYLSIDKRLKVASLEEPQAVKSGTIVPGISYQKQTLSNSKKEIPMFCNSCGKEINADQKFCTYCGKPTVATVSSGTNRVRRHVYSLGVLWIIYSSYRLLVRGLLLIPAAGFLRRFLQMPFFGDMPIGFGHFLGGIFEIVAILVIVKSIAGIVTGIGLVQCAPWARPLALVLGVYALIHPFLGTLLGIYTLWVLSPAGAGDEYETLAHKTVTA